MKMDHALRLAAGPPVRAEQFLSTASRLARDTAPDAGEAWPPLPRRGAGVPLAPDNLVTLRACQRLLSRTLTLLE